MRRAATALLRIVARIFFRRIEIVGLERVPDDVPVIFAVNHPNGLLDSVFLLCFVPRRVVFLDELPKNAMGKVQKPLLRQLVSQSLQ